MPERELDVLIRSLDPLLHEGEFVFCSSEVAGAIALFREAEGVTSIVERARADELGLEYSYIAAWITLTVESDLDAIGFLAAISAQLARAEVSCNVISALHHDHLFVPYARRDDAMAALGALQRSSAGNDL